MSETITVQGVSAEHMYKIGDTVRFVGHALSWWEKERPFFPVPVQEAVAEIEWVSTKGNEVSLSISEPWKTEWSMRILWL